MLMVITQQAPVNFPGPRSVFLCFGSGIREFGIESDKCSATPNNLAQ